MYKSIFKKAKRLALCYGTNGRRGINMGKKHGAEEGNDEDWTDANVW